MSIAESEVGVGVCVGVHVGVVGVVGAVVYASVKLLRKYCLKTAINDRHKFDSRIIII